MKIYFIKVKTNTNPYMQRECRPGQYVTIDYPQEEIGPAFPSFVYSNTIVLADVYKTKESAKNAIKKYGAGGVTYNIIEFEEIGIV